MKFKIYKYLPLFVHRLKYLMCCFAASVQLVPKSYSHPPFSLLRLKLITVHCSVNHSSAVGCVQLVPKYISKVKLDRDESPNILSETIEIHKNGA